MQLERLAIGGLTLGALPEGEFRWLSDDEVRDSLGYPPEAAPSRSAAANDPPASNNGGYELLDSGDRRRLERFGGHLVVRPCPSATWRRGAPNAPWKSAPLQYVDDGDGKAGDWQGEGPEAGSTGPSPSAPEGSADAGASWQMDSGAGFVLALQPGPSGQLGAFPEQRGNWEWLRNTCADALATRGPARVSDDDGQPGRPTLRVLNLFGHTGASTLACAAGAREERSGSLEIVHVDGARSAVSRARANAELSGLGHVTTRWICEDAVTYCKRAARRGETFDGIIVDPPAFGRGGKKGSEWRITRDMPDLLDVLATLLSERPCFVLLTGHDQRWPHERLRDEVGQMLPAPTSTTKRSPRVAHGQMVLRATADGGRDLPMGAFARWSAPPPTDGPVA